MINKLYKNILFYTKSFLLLDLLKGLLVTLKYLFKRKVTLLYPQVTTPTSNRFRGLLALRKNADGSERCIACKLCEVACPARAITIESKMEQDGSRRTTKYEIDMFKCINCGICEEACPVDAVVVTPIQHYHMEQRGENIMTKEKLLEIGSLHEQQLAKRIREDSKYR